MCDLEEKKRKVRRGYTSRKDHGSGERLKINRDRREKQGCAIRSCNIATKWMSREMVSTMLQRHGMMMVVG